METWLVKLQKQLVLLTTITTAAEVSGCHVVLFGLPQLLPDQEEVFPKVVAVADRLAFTHEHLVLSAKREAGRFNQSLVLFKQAIIRFFHQISNRITQLLKKQEQLINLKRELQQPSPFSLVEQNHQKELDQVNKRLKQIARELHLLEKKERAILLITACITSVDEITRLASHLKFRQAS